MATPPSDVAILVYPGCIVAEVLDTAIQIRRTGRPVIFAAPSKRPFRDESGLMITPDAAVDELQSQKLAAIVVAGGNPDGIMGDVGPRSLIREIAGHGIVAGICAGVVVLADAGMLDGRRITHNYRDPWAPAEVQRFVAPMWVNAEVEPDLSIGVVQDGNVITALPEASREFASAIVNQLSDPVE